MTPKNNNMKKQKQNSRQKKVVVKAKPKKATNSVRGLLNMFTRSIQKPFDPQSFGCRVPDLFSFPTSTYHLHGNVVLKSGTGGSGSVLFCPNPLLSAIDISAESGSTGSIGSTSMIAYASNNKVYGAGITNNAGTMVNNLATVFGDYRVVSWGIKVSNLIPELSATGKVYIYVIPCIDTVPTYGQLASGSSGNAIAQNTSGYSSSQLSTAQVLNFPTAFELTEQDLLHGDIEIHGSYVSPRYYDFKAANDYNNWNATQIQGDSAVVTSGTGVVNLLSNRDPTRMMGGCMIGITYEGFPASTLSCINVEYIYHLEGTPALQASTNIPMTSTLPAPVVGSTDIVESAIRATTRTNVTWIDKATDFLDRGVNFINSPAGQAAVGTAAKFAAMML